MCAVMPLLCRGSVGLCGGISQWRITWIPNHQRGVGTTTIGSQLLDEWGLLKFCVCHLRVNGGWVEEMAFRGIIFFEQHQIRRPGKARGNTR
jgi:hypothetical protein